MNRRLQQFLELEQMKAAQFADIMGIQRSSVSHILSGRNKPGFDFIQKFLTKFPSVNPDWLILGKGKPFREMNVQAQAQQDSASPSLFSMSVDNRDNGWDTEENPGVEDDSADLFTDDRDTRPAAPDVRRVTLFYSDGTFQEFYPPK